MALLNKQISALTGGVSQQPDAIRSDSQALLQENFLSAPSIGLIKRKGTKYKGTLGSISDDAFIKYVDTEENNPYIIVIDQGVLSVYNTDGSQASVSYDGTAQSYFNTQGNTARDSFSSTTIGASTIIANNNVTVGINNDVYLNSLGVDDKPEALVYVKQGVFGKTYKVRVAMSDGSVIEASYQTPDGGLPAHTRQTDTTFIAEEIAADFTTQLALPANQNTINVDQSGNLLRITIAGTQEDFSISTEDGFGDNGMYAIKDSISLYSDLPRKAPPGFTTAVTSDGSTALPTEYYVTAVETLEVPVNNQEFPVVNWIESTKLGTRKGLDEDTLPHEIVRQPNGNFVVRKIEYGDRIVGDEDSSQDPSFTNSVIQDVFVHANRLGFISGESVSLSESGNLFNFYPTSIATLLDGDPIDVTVNAKDVSEIKYAVPWNNRVILIGNTQQYALESQGNLSLSSVSIEPVSDYIINTQTEPLVNGTSFFFPMNNGQFSTLREYYVVEQGELYETEEITSQIPSYIPRDVNFMAGSGDARSLIINANGERDTLYVYQNQLQGKQKIQSAWHKFIFSGLECVSAGLLGEDVHLILRNPSDSSCILCSLDFSEDIIDVATGKFKIYLDNCFSSDSINKTYDSVTDKTTYDVPFIFSNNLEVVDVDPNGAYGKSIDYLIEGTSITVRGDTTSRSFVFGNTFNSKYTFAPITLREQSAQGNLVGVTSGRTQVLKALVTFSETTIFSVETEIEGRQPQTKDFNGRITGSFGSVFGETPTETGSFKAPIGARNTKTKISLVNDSYLPSNFQFVEFVIRFNSNKGQRVG